MRFILILFTSLFFSFSVHANHGNSDNHVDKPFSIGFGLYTNTISITRASGADDELSGTAFSFGYTLSDRFALRASLFSLDHDDFSAIDSSGYDLVAYFGQGLASLGFKMYVGGGLYKDEWEVSGFSTTFDGLQLSAGLGNNWDTISVDFVLGIREAGDYEDFVNDGFSRSAISTMLSVSTRF